MEDIGKELCGRVKKALEKRVSSNAFMVRLKEEISEGRATLKDASLYSQTLGIYLRRAIKEVVTPDELPDSTLYYNIAYSILEPLLRDTYEDVNSICADIQRKLDDKAGIHLAPQKADFPAERVRAAAGSASTRDTAAHGIEVLERTSENITAAFSDDYMKANADFRSRAGLDTHIERTTDGNCCPWCSKKAGRYAYPDKAPRDVFQRHDNCGCTVEYVCSKGRQDVWSKKWRDDQGKAERKAYADGAEKPVKLSGKEAEELEKRLTSERKSGIIRMGKASSENTVWLPKGKPISNKEYTDLRNYAASKGIRLEGFKGSDVDTELIKDFIDQIDEMIKVFPELKGEDRKTLILSLSDFMDDEDYAQSNKNRAHIIEINANAFRDKVSLERDYESQVKQRWFVQGTDYRAIAKHELGHRYQYIHNIDNSTIIEIAMKSARVNTPDDLFAFLSDNLSHYSSKYIDGSEIISEVFADVFGSDEPSYFSTRFMDFLKEMV